MNQRKRLDYIDSIRGLAAIGIACVYHLNTVPFPYKNGSSLNDVKVMQWLYSNGYLMVELFFILSGFISFYCYQNAICVKKISLGTFIKRRVVRIFPVMWISLIIASVLSVVYFMHNGSFLLGGDCPKTRT